MKIIYRKKIITINQNNEVFNKIPPYSSLYVNNSSIDLNCNTIHISLDLSFLS